MKYFYKSLLFLFCIFSYNLSQADILEENTNLTTPTNSSFRNNFQVTYHQTPSIKYYPNFSRYSVSQFRRHFNKNRSSEETILSQEKLYLHDAFVEFAKTLPSYKKFITEFHKEYHTISFFNKAGRFLSFAYTPGLQERFCDLFKEILQEERQKAIQAQQQQAQQKKHNPPKKQPVSPIIYEQILEYQEALPCYKTNNPRLFKYTKKRIEVLNDITNNNVSYTTEKYQLSDLSLELLHEQQQDISLLKQCYGDQYQQCLHQEGIEIIEQTASLTYTSSIYQHRDTLVDSVVALCEYNHAKQTEKASLVADFCWALLDYGSAIAEGALLGVATVVTTAVEHPFQTIACAIAGEYVLAYQLSKLLYHVTEIELTALSDKAQAIEKWDTFLNPVTSIINAIQNKQVSLRDVLKTGTAIAVGWKAHNKLLSGLNKFYQHAQTHAINFANYNPSASPEKYMSTPEGSLLRVGNESANITQNNTCPPRCVNQYTNLKNELKIEEFTSILKVTKHGARRLIERGFEPEETLSVIEKADFITRQSDGAKVFLKSFKKGKSHCIVINEQTTEVVTAMKHVSKKDLINLSKGYK